MKLTKPQAVLLILAMLAASVGMFHASTAKAAGWTGCYVGAHAGAMATVTDTTLSSPAIPGASIGIDSLGADGFTGGAKLGCDVQVSSHIVLGAFADYSFSNAETTLGLSAGGFAASVSTEFEREWSVGGRAGYLATPTTLVFLQAAYVQAETSDLVFTSSFGDTSWGIDPLSGWMVGGGFETMLTSNIALGLDYRFTRFDTERVTLTPLPVDVDLDADQHVVRLSLSYRFGVEPLVQQTK